MRFPHTLLVMLVSGVLLAMGCGESSSPSSSTDAPSSPQAASNARSETYATVRLDADVGDLSGERKKMVRLFIEAAQSMDGLFWEQAYGNRDSLLQTIGDPQQRRFVKINYGPWDRRADDEPFIEGVGAKPPGANFYPEDMTTDEFNRAAQSDETLDDRHTMVRRLPDGSLTALPYHQFFAHSLMTAASRLREAASLAENDALQRYLELRAEALTTGTHRPSTRAWMDLDTNELDLVIGARTTDEDRLFGHKAAAGALVFRRNRDWSRRLRRYAERLPARQSDLPVPDQYESALPDRPSDLIAYDVLYRAGQANAGPTPIVLTLPADTAVRAEMGARHLLLTNALRATVDEVLRPTADVLIADGQRSHVTAAAVAANTILGERARALDDPSMGAGRGPVREAPTPPHAAMETATAEVLGLALATTIAGEASRDVDRMGTYTSFLAGLFRSLRLGSVDARSRASLLSFNYFRDRGAVSRDPETGTYAVNPDAMEQAVTDLSRELLRLQDDGDAGAIAAFVETYGTMPDPLQADLDRLEQEGIPVDVTFEQGPSVLQGLPIRE